MDGSIFVKTNGVLIATPFVYSQHNCVRPALINNRCFQHISLVVMGNCEA